MSILISNAAVYTMDDACPLIERGYVSVEGGRIAHVGAERPQREFDREIDAAGKGLMPGFVNAHTHLPMTLMRGYGGGHGLQSWLNDYIFPAEARLDNRAVAAGTALGLAEMIASGVTCVADMYDHCEAIVAQINAAGLSANIARGVTLFTDGYRFDTFPGTVEQVELAERWHGHDQERVRVDACVHGEYTSRPALWEDVARFAQERGLRMHIHVSETEGEQAGCLERWGTTPIQILSRYGLWEQGGIAAHCVYTTPEDWALMAEKGVACAHNPWSNLKLGSGIAPVPDMLAAGVTVALGTDGMSSHNCCDFFSDVKLAATLHGGARRDPLAVTPRQALWMATRGGALALGRTDTGMIAPGLWADLILVDFSAPNLTPCHSVEENLAFAARGCDVVMNMARGQVIYENGAFLTLDLERARAEVAEYALPLVFPG